MSLSVVAVVKIGRNVIYMLIDAPRTAHTKIHFPRVHAPRTRTNPAVALVGANCVQYTPRTTIEDMH